MSGANDVGEALQKIARALSPTEIGSTVARGRSKMIKDITGGINEVKQEAPAAIQAVKSGYQKVKSFLGGNG